MTPHQIAVPYKPDDYVPITLANSAPLVFCVKPDFPARDGKEFIELLRKNPGKYTYGGDGIGGTVHLAGERIFTKLGVSGNARIIPFNSAGETLQNFLGGHVDIYGGSFPPIMPHLKDKAMRCVLVTSAERSFVAPDVTALADLGIAGEATPVWGGLIAPKGTPADRIAVLEKAFSRSGALAGIPRLHARAGHRGGRLERWPVQGFPRRRIQRDGAGREEPRPRQEVAAGRRHESSR